MSTLEYLQKKFNLDLSKELPIEIPDVGRNNLARWLNELDFKIGVEVGVAAGEYSEILCYANPQMKIYGIDSWIPYNGYTDYTKESTFATLYHDAKKRLSKYTNYEFINELSMDAVKRFKDESLDFVYIDANHDDPYITQDITEWIKKVKKGGIIAGHDYARIIRGWDVIRAVQKYTKKNNINPWFVIGLSAKIPGMIRDDSRSWMIIKQ